MQTIKDLIENSFVFGDLGTSEKDKMVNELADIAIQRTVMRALDKMTDEEVEKFENTMGEDADPKEVFGYLETSVPSFYDMLREEVIRLQAVALDNQGKL